MHVADRVRAGALVGILAIALTSIACNLSFSVPASDGGRAAVLFVAPDPNSQIAEGATIQLAVRAEDAAGVSRIEFTVDDQALGSQSAPAGKQTTFTALQIWVASGVRGHLLSATAYRIDNVAIGTANLTVNVLPLPGVVPATLSAPVQPPTAFVNVPAPTIAPAVSTPIPVAPSVTPSSPTLALPPPSQVPALPSATAPAIVSGVPQARITTAFLNVRAGPGPTFQTLGQVKAGDVLNILARNEDRTWWAIQAPGGLRGWILNNPAYIQVTGDTSGVPLGAAQPTPTP